MLPIRKGQLKFHGAHAGLADKRRFERFLKRLKKKDWIVYAKKSFGGPEAVLAYLSRYTHRVAISNHRLVKLDDKGVTFKYKDYRIEGPGRYKTMTLATHEFIRRFLMHVLPRRFHRIRHYGLLANGNRAANIAKARELLDAAPPIKKADTETSAETEEPDVLAHPCPCCGGRLIIIEAFDPGCDPKHRPPAEGIDSS